MEVTEAAQIKCHVVEENLEMEHIEMKMYNIWR